MRTARLALVSLSTLFSLALGCQPMDNDLDLDASTPTMDALVTDAAAPVAPASAPFEHGAVLHEGADWVVLATSDEDPSDGASSAHPAGEFHQAVVRPLSASARRTASAPASVHVYKGSRWVCDATVQPEVALAVAERAIDEDGAGWDRELDEVWDNGLRAIAAKLTATRGDCSTGEWARDAALEAPVFASETAVSASIAAVAYAALRDSTEGARLAAEHRAQCDEERSCDRTWDLREDVTRSVKLFTTRDGRRWVFAAARTTNACGGFGAELTVTAELAADASALRAPVFSTDPTRDVDAMIEREDGGIEWRSGQERLRYDAARALVIDRTDVPVYGCGC